MELLRPSIQKLRYGQYQFNQHNYIFDSDSSPARMLAAKDATIDGQ